MVNPASYLTLSNVASRERGSPHATLLIESDKIEFDLRTTLPGQGHNPTGRLFFSLE